MNRELEKWMASAVTADGVVETHSLHIDQLDPTLKDRDTWKGAVIELLLTAEVIRSLHQWSMEIAAGMSLVDTPPGFSIQEATLDQLFATGDWSPPNLYVFPQDSVPWAQTTILRDSVEPVDGESLRVLVGEWFDRWEGAERAAFWVAVDRR